MANWVRAGFRIRVLNFFTESAYAPRSTVQERDIPALREREDRSALSAISRAITVKNCRFLDAPLRLQIAVNDVFNPAVYRLRIDNVGKDVMSAISGFVRHSLVLCPLGLGGHVDHLAVRSAAITACGAATLSFYEDLPYAIWTREDGLKERVNEAQKQTGVSLRPVTIRGDKPIWNKRRIISRYSSQITREEAGRIAQFAERYGGGERIWIPQYGPRWNSAIYSTRHSASAKGHSRSTHI